MSKASINYSPLSGRIMLGRVNQSTGVAIGEQRDVTSNFIGILLEKFPINTMQNIECNGVVEATVIVLDEKKAVKYKAAADMFDVLCSIENDSGQVPDFMWRAIQDVIVKAGGVAK